ncbi:GNAT family N-acetyltransferase [Yoonia sp. 2307UL14-13]|uniref:GNAT family N-acetyltransferase n=1 Tax=Yoonia sp. 2307UL14-13 TaxID=3126506 RepID=UPI003094E3C6
MTDLTHPSIHSAKSNDADGVSAVLTALVAAGKRTKPADIAFALDHYIAHPDTIRCSVAVDQNGTILGFQSLKLAIDGNIYDVTPGWGIIGTHIHPEAARRGVGRALFVATCDAARAAGIAKIDATIGEANAEGLAYYSAMGFATYRRMKGAVCKCFDPHVSRIS